MILRVECHPGHVGEQEPQAFFLGDRRIEISTIADRWLSQEYSYFKVQANDHASYILRRDKRTEKWELTLFQSGIAQQKHGRLV
jgi:hypothetical protein